MTVTMSVDQVGHPGLLDRKNPQGDFKKNSLYSQDLEGWFIYTRPRKSIAMATTGLELCNTTSKVSISRPSGDSAGVSPVSWVTPPKCALKLHVSETQSHGAPWCAWKGSDTGMGPASETLYLGTVTRGADDPASACAGFSWAVRPRVETELLQPGTWETREA